MATLYTDEQIELIMEQAQVFASAWSLVGGPFDAGGMLETAEEEKKALRALLSASKPAVPEGWKLVPVEPSEEMIQAACLKQSNTAFESYEKWLDSHSGGVSARIRQLVAGDYRVMLAASPAAGSE